ncbi:MAG: hypothetical protein U1F68_05660 [Gammaproteobacteria bacterium]
MTQGTEGWFFRTRADLKDDFYLSEETKTYFRRLVKALAQRKTELIYLPLPPRGLLHSAFLIPTKPRQAPYELGEAESLFDAFVKDLQSTGMIVPNLREWVNAHSTDKSQFFFKRDHHWTPDGARAASQAVAAALANTPAYAALAKATYQSKPAGEQLMKHTMGQEIQRLCVGEIPPEPFMKYETRVVQTSGAKTEDNADLFGAATDSSALVLLGSSFSAVEDFNFDGFLSEATGLEVANHAISGGQLFNAIISYTSAPEFADAKPPFIVWEAPAYYNLGADSAPAFRQMIPAVYGACDSTKAVSTAKFSIQRGQGGKLLTVDPGAGVSGSRYYLFLTTPNKTLVKFTLKIDYADGDYEWFAIDRTENFNNSGRFFVEFSDDIESSVTAISIEGLPNLNANLEAVLCPTPET